MNDSLLVPKTDILPPAQRRLWPLLAPTLSLGYVLYGGTAIALRLGHRESVDFDFFTEARLSQEALYDRMPFLNETEVVKQSRDSLTVIVPPTDSSNQTVMLSFFGEISFGRFGEPSVTHDGVLYVASMIDLLATKLKVILQRAESKDYRAIAAILEAGTDLARGLVVARSMFAPTFQPSESLRALVFFEDGDLVNLSEGNRSILVNAVHKIQGEDLEERPGPVSRVLSGK